MMSIQEKEDVKIILDYLWRDEEKHYRESEYDKTHIFRVMKRLAKATNYES